MSIPLFFLITMALQTEKEVIADYYHYHFEVLLIHTFGLGLLAAILSSILGSVLGYIFAKFRFAFQSILKTLFILPLAIPIYVYSFLFLGWLEPWLGSSKPYWLFIFVFVCATYPYSFIVSYQFFKNESLDIKNAASLLGLNNRQYTYRILLPMFRPIFLSGFIITYMEFLSDFGATQLFGLNTFSTAIYKFWSSYQSLGTAATIALQLLLAVLVLVRIQKGSVPSVAASENVPPRAASFLSLALLLVLVIVLILPLYQIFVWSLNANWPAIVIPTLNTMTLSFLFSMLLTTILSILLFLTPRGDRFFDWLSFGYALPGTLLAVAVLIPLFYLQRFYDGFSRTLIISFIILFLAWTIRFFKVAWDPMNKSRQLFDVSIEEVSMLTLRNPILRWWKLLLPNIRYGAISSFIFVFLEVSKELPIVLLTRPFGWDTLAVKIFEYTSESDWIRAAPPALLLIIIGAIGVIWAERWRGAKN